MDICCRHEILEMDRVARRRHRGWIGGDDEWNHKAGLGWDSESFSAGRSTSELLMEARKEGGDRGGNQIASNGLL